MRNGHYTAGDIEDMTIVPSNKGNVQTAYGRVDGVLIWSNRFDITIGEADKKKNYKRLENVPAVYKIVAEIIQKKVNGRGASSRSRMA